MGDERTYTHMGQPEGLTTRAAAAWRRANTHYITNHERIDPEVVADPPACFTQREWNQYLSTLPLGGYRLPDSPYAIASETNDERLARQRRATRAAACSDCTLERQMKAEEAGVCNPPPHAFTPRNCTLPAGGIEGCSEHGRYCMSAIRHALGTMEGSGDDTTVGRGATAPVMRIQEGVPEREVR